MATCEREPVRRGACFFWALLGVLSWLALGCGSPPAASPSPAPEWVEAPSEPTKPEGSRHDPSIPQTDPLTGTWAGTRCGFQVILRVYQISAEGEITAVISNGSELGIYGFDDDDPWFEVSPLAAPGTYAGRTIYRNLILSRWFPTRIVMVGENTFTQFDDVTMRTCGDTTNTFLRMEPRGPGLSEPIERSGSGFLLRSTDVVVTNYHVIGAGSQITLSFPGGSIYRGEVVHADARNDLALIRAVGFVPSERRGLAFENPSTVSVGDEVFALGYPLGLSLSSRPSMVRGDVSSDVGAGDSREHFRMTAPVNPGNSGGPILDTHGRVVGIVSSKWVQEGVEGVTFGIRASYAAKAARAAGLAVPEPTASRVLAPGEIFNAAAQDVVSITAK